MGIKVTILHQKLKKLKPLKKIVKKKVAVLLP